MCSLQKKFNNIIDNYFWKNIHNILLTFNNFVKVTPVELSSPPMSSSFGIKVEHPWMVIKPTFPSQDTNYLPLVILLLILSYHAIPSLHKVFFILNLVYVFTKIFFKWSSPIDNLTKHDSNFCLQFGTCAKYIYDDK